MRPGRFPNLSALISAKLVGVSDFFGDDPPPGGEPFATEPTPDPVWLQAPTDMLAGAVPLELIIGRSKYAVVTLTKIRAFPTGVAMTLGVRLSRRPQRDVFAEVFDGPYGHERNEAWRRNRLKWGFELPDGRSATNVNTSWMDAQSPPAEPVLSGDGGGGDEREIERAYWLWPLPPAGSAQVVCQWLDLGIPRTAQSIDTTLILEAAGRAVPLWPPD